MSIMNILPLFAQGAIMEAYNLTDLDTALIIAVLAVVAFVVYELVHRYKNGSEPAEDDYADNKSASENVNEEENFKKEKTINVRVGNKYAGMDTPTLVKAILKDLNCKYEESDDHIDFLFSYQGENFVARAPDKRGRCARLYTI